MGELSGQKRISAAFKQTFTGKKPALDRIPAYQFAGHCNAQLVGASIKEFLTKPDVFVKAQLAGYERYKPDIVIMMWDLLTDVEALGCELSFPEDSMCFPSKHSLEDKGQLSALRLPDPSKDGRIPGYLEAAAKTQKAITESIVSTVIAGPWTIAIGLRGATELILDSVDDPDYVHELMRFCTQVSINFAEAIVPLGLGIGYSEAPASCSLISPKMYRNFVFPYHKQIVDHFKAKKVGLGLHICGNANPILEDMVETGVTNISIDAPTSLAKAVEAARGKAVVIGNVATNLFMSGNRDKLKQAMAECVALAPEDSGYVLATGCEVPGIAPPETIDWFMQLAGELGRYDQ